ncbi:hypothetical protein F511_09828 [Dorcoceras hygrometricum]|uniref:Uncharacterized protein n=1 Tax=Dorcoceras hygrometricum TaxID=472368 RepID=A0A2Z7C932_9LAMI|nr:hypothetical protein F511_09828 [Dorcoceras hygrometricum]
MESATGRRMRRLLLMRRIACARLDAHVAHAGRVLCTRGSRLGRAGRSMSGAIARVVVLRRPRVIATQVAAEARCCVASWLAGLCDARWPMMGAASRASSRAAVHALRYWPPAAASWMRRLVDAAAPLVAPLRERWGAARCRMSAAGRENWFPCARAGREILDIVAGRCAHRCGALCRGLDQSDLIDDRSYDEVSVVEMNLMFIVGPEPVGPLWPPTLLTLKPPPPQRAAAGAAVFAGKIVSGQLDEENPFVLISSGLLVKPDEGVSDLVVDRIGVNYRNLPRRAGFL